MKYLNLILLMFIALTATAQVASICQAPALLEKTYRQDVTAMALERIYNLQSADTAAIVVPQAYRDTILSGLSAIFNTGTQLDADSIFLVHCIHDYTRLYYNWTIELGINAKSDWAKKWAQHDMNTGYGALDSFMKKYGFSLGNYWAKDAF